MQKTAILTLTSVCTVAVEANRFVDFDGSQCDAAGAKPMGASVTKAAVGEAFAVDVLGTTKIEAGAAIALGAKGLTPVKTDANGRAIAQGGAGEIAGYLNEASLDHGLVEFRWDFQLVLGDDHVEILFCVSDLARPNDSTYASWTPHNGGLNRTQVGAFSTAIVFGPSTGFTQIPNPVTPLPDNASYNISLSVVDAGGGAKTITIEEQTLGELFSYTTESSPVADGSGISFLSSFTTTLSSMRVDNVGFLDLS